MWYGSDQWVVLNEFAVMNNPEPTESKQTHSIARFTRVLITPGTKTRETVSEVLYSLIKKSSIGCKWNESIQRIAHETNFIAFKSIFVCWIDSKRILENVERPTMTFTSAIVWSEIRTDLVSKWICAKHFRLRWIPLDYPKSFRFRFDPWKITQNSITTNDKTLRIHGRSISCYYLFVFIAEND